MQAEQTKSQQQKREKGEKVIKLDLESSALAISRLREDYNDKWKVVVDIIRRSIKGEATSCGDLIIETFL
mgnify:CR=1 FL=1